MEGKNRVFIAQYVLAVHGALAVLWPLILWLAHDAITAQPWWWEPIGWNVYLAVSWVLIWASLIHPVLAIVVLVVIFPSVFLYPVPAIRLLSIDQYVGAVAFWIAILDLIDILLIVFSLIILFWYRLTRTNG